MNKITKLHAFPQVRCLRSFNRGCVLPGAVGHRFQRGCGTGQESLTLDGSHHADRRIHVRRAMLAVSG